MGRNGTFYASTQYPNLRLHRGANPEHASDDLSALLLATRLAFIFATMRYWRSRPTHGCKLMLQASRLCAFVLLSVLCHCYHFEHLTCQTHSFGRSASALAGQV